MENEKNLVLTSALKIMQSVEPAVQSIENPSLIRNTAKSLVVRCQVKSDTAKINSIIIKQFKQNEAFAYTEWASLQFLNSIKPVKYFIPQFYGGDQQNKFFIIEDFTDSLLLNDLLNGSNPNLLINTLQKIAENTAQLHLATLAKAEEFFNIRQKLPYSESLSRYSEARHWFISLNKIENWADALNIKLPDSFAKACEIVLKTYTEPGALLCFSHSDLVPSNILLKNGIYFIDFEYANYRHALMDLVCWYIICPLPDYCVNMMQQSYFKQLNRGIRLSQQQFELEWAYVCIWQSFFLLMQLPRQLLENDLPNAYSYNWTGRQAVLLILNRLYESTKGFTELEPVAAFAGQMFNQLNAKWHFDQLLPYWPVLDG